MQLSSKLTALTAFLATASALTLDPRASPPSVALVSYELPKCTETDATGNVFKPVDTIIPENNCTNVPTFDSFKVFIFNPCPAGTKPEVTVYTMKGCSGQGFVEMEFNNSNPECMQDPYVAEENSALFKCNTA